MNLYIQSIPDCIQLILNKIISQYIINMASTRNKNTKKLIRLASNAIQTNIPNENKLIKEYYFYQGISHISDEKVDYGINRFLESKQYLKGKGFNYLIAIIKAYDANKEVMLKNELLMRGKTPAIIKIKE